jgi:hypothetical protein
VAVAIKQLVVLVVDKMVQEQDRPAVVHQVRELLAVIEARSFMQAVAVERVSLVELVAVFVVVQVVTALLLIRLGV